MIRAVEIETGAVLRLRDCRYHRLPHDPPLPELTQDGRIDAPYRFEGDGFALPAEGVSIAVRSDSNDLGWLECLPADPTAGVSRDRRRAALTMTDHLALVLASRHVGPA